MSGFEFHEVFRLEAPGTDQGTVIARIAISDQREGTPPAVSISNGNGGSPHLTRPIWELLKASIDHAFDMHEPTGEGAGQ